MLVLMTLMILMILMVSDNADRSCWLASTAIVQPTMSLVKSLYSICGFVRSHLQFLNHTLTHSLTQ